MARAQNSHKKSKAICAFRQIIRLFLNKPQDESVESGAPQAIPKGFLSLCVQLKKYRPGRRQTETRALVRH